MSTQTTLMNQHLLEDYLRQVGATLQAEEFCKVVSHYYHEIESGYYDQVHQEIFEDETVGAWRAALQAAAPHLPKRLHVLDIGCGTGFAAQTVLQTLGSDRVEQLVCIDPSPHMLNICEQKLTPYPCVKRFQHMDIAQLLEEKPVFDLIVTNSVLHHVFDLGAFLRHLDRALAPGGVYICGHEPSARYYTIAEMKQWNRRFNSYLRIRRGLKVKRMLKRLLSDMGLIARGVSISDKVNSRLVADGYITVPLAANALHKMVDIHVPQSTGEYLWGRPGFSPEAILSEYLPNYTSIFSATYHYIKAPLNRLGFYWRHVNNRLKERHPDGGADIIMAFRKTS